MADLGDQLEVIARRLRLVAEELVPELRSAIKDAVTPVQDDIRAGLRPKLPDAYAEVLDADLSFRLSQRTSDSDPGVTLTATARSKQRKIKRLDGGILAHPLYGHRRHWYNQAVGSGWFSEPAEDAAPKVREQIEETLGKLAEKATGGG